MYSDLTDGSLFSDQLWELQEAEIAESRKAATKI